MASGSAVLWLGGGLRRMSEPDVSFVRCNPAGMTNLSSYSGAIFELPAKAR